MKTPLFLLPQLVTLVGWVSPAAAQDSVYGDIWASAHALHSDPSTPGSYESRELYSSGSTDSVRAYDEGAFGARANAEATASSVRGKIGISAGGESFIPGKNNLQGSSSGSAHADLTYRDVIWFYSTDIPYATQLKLHLRAQLTGSITGYGDGSNWPPVYATFDGRADFQFAVEDAGPSSTQTHTLEFMYDGSQTVVTGNTHPYIDLFLEVPNTPNRHYNLLMSAGVDGNTLAYDDGSSDFALVSSYDFQFEHSLSWVGLVSAETLYGGVPVTGVSIGSRSLTDYNQSYAPPLASIPEPGTYGMAAVLVLILGARWRSVRRTKVL